MIICAMMMCRAAIAASTTTLDHFCNEGIAICHIGKIGIDQDRFAKKIFQIQGPIKAQYL